MANKKQQEAYYNGQLSDAATMKALGRQMIAKATQIESAAKSALATLGTKPERTRKGQTDLSDNVKLRLISNLTKDKSA